MNHAHARTLILAAALGLAACARHEAPLTYPPAAARDRIECDLYAHSVAPMVITAHAAYADPDKVRAATQSCMAARGWQEVGEKG